MENSFDLGLNIASIETELPDPVITLTGADSLTASGTADMPLISLDIHGRSWQEDTWVVDSTALLEALGYTLCGIPVSEGGNYTDESGQQWICDTLEIYADGAGKIVNKIGVIDSYDGETIEDSYMSATGELSTGAKIIYLLNTPTETSLTAEQVQSVISQTGSSGIAYGKSVQDGTPTPENPIEIVSTSEFHKDSVPIENIGDNGTVSLTTYGANLIKCVGTFGSANGFVATYRPISLSAGTYSLIVETPDNTTPGNVVNVNFKNKSNVTLISSVKASNPINRVWTFEVTAETAPLIHHFEVYAAIANTVYAGLDYRIMLNLGDTVLPYEPYTITTAAITTGLPLLGVPVPSGGNYTDSDGQEWVCDTLEYDYGKPARTIKRVASSTVVDKYEMLGYTTMIWEYSPNKSTVYQYFGNGGDIYQVGNFMTIDFSILWERNYNYNTGEMTVDEANNSRLQLRIGRYPGDPALDWSYALVGNWTLTNGHETGNSNRVEYGTYTGPFLIPNYKLTNGEDIPESYICTTGAPTLGAEIIYPAEDETILLTTKETEQLNALSGYNTSTTVKNDVTAEMTVKLLKEDYEMQYIYWIKESQSFVCEKSGKYKVICVGGGASGGLALSTATECMQAVGSTTSFGNVISASGGGRSKASTLNDFQLVGGQSGYDGINYASTAYVHDGSRMVLGNNSEAAWGTGHGYGAGGGSHKVTASTKSYTAVAGACGKVESTIVDLEENQTVFCTVGGGGVLNLSDENVAEYLTSVGDESTVSSGDGAKISACASNGADGVIIVQYLGL